MTVRLLPVLLFLFPLLQQATHPAPHPPRTGKDLVVFFAVEKYQNSSLSNLQNPVKNARAIAAELHNRFGFDTLVLVNPSQARVITQLNELTRLYATNADGRHPADGQLFLFFSGHGMSEDENGYFLPADADPAQPWAKGIAYEIWRPKIDRINCRHILVAIDACYSVRFDPDWKNRPDGQFKRPGELTDAQKALANYEQYTARVFFTSDNKEDKTPDRSNFARMLLDGLRNAPARDGFLTSSQLFANHVEGATPTPRAGSFGSDEPGSAFLFYEKQSISIAIQGNIPIVINKLILIHRWKAHVFTTVDTVTVTEASYYLSQNEVSLAEYKEFVDASGYVTDAEKEGLSWIIKGSEWSWEEKEGVNWRCDAQGNLRPLSEYNHPVTHISLNDACQYCKWLEQKTGLPYRLPTDDELNYVADGGILLKDTIYVKSRTKVFPVNLFDLDEWGLYNTDSNVWEWCGGTCETRVTPVLLGNEEMPSVCYVRGGSLDLPNVILAAVYSPEETEEHCIAPVTLRCGTLGFRLAMTK